MSSTEANESGGESPAPGRPGNQRHSSSWIERLHRKHDLKYHQERQPLLAEEQAEQDDMEEAASPPAPRTRTEATKDFFKAIPPKSREAAQKTRRACGRNIKHILLALFITLMVVGVGVSLRKFYFRPGKDQDPKPESHKKDYCTSPACIHAASDLLYSLSPRYKDLDPCTQFDVLACEGFEERHDLRPDQGDMFRGTLMSEAGEITLRHILETDVSDIDRADRENFAKLKADYDACMDEETILSKGLAPLQTVIEGIKSLYLASELQKMEELPLSADHGLAPVYTYLIGVGVDALLSIGVGADDKFPDVQAVFAAPPRRIGLPSKEYYNDTKTVSSYKEVMTEVLPYFLHFSGSESLVNGLNASELASAIIDFETGIAKATPPEEDLNDITKSYNKMKVDEVEKSLPQLPLGKVVAILAAPQGGVKDIIVASPSYLEALSDLLQETSKEVVEAYLIWKTIQAYSGRVEGHTLSSLKRFDNVLQGKAPDAKPDRWRTCIGAVDQDLGWILSKFFIDQAFSPESKKFGDQIVSDIKSSFATFLNKASWMTSDNRERAIGKVHAIDQKIGYPVSNPDILNPDALKKYYQDLDISNTTFFENAVHAAKFGTKEEWSRLGKPTRHDEWGMTVPTVNAYYNPAGNEIVFPAGIMQSPVFYEPNVPQYLSYGAFGAVSGHELSHAFDNTGSQYDETGKYVNWWSNDTRVAFEDKTKCFVKQYEKYSVTGPDGSEIHVNGRLTLGENVADAGGIHAAFHAWKKREAESPSKLLPGLDHFSKDQLFFLNYANWWCGKSTKETDVRRIYTDPHAPKFARISGTMTNSKDFRKAFNCPSKQPTCDLW